MNAPAVSIAGLYGSDCGDWLGLADAEPLLLRRPGDRKVQGPDQAVRGQVGRPARRSVSSRSSLAQASAAFRLLGVDFRRQRGSVIARLPGEDLQQLCTLDRRLAVPDPMTDAQPAGSLPALI